MVKPKSVKKNKCEMTFFRSLYSMNAFKSINTKALLMYNVILIVINLILNLITYYLNPLSQYTLSEVIANAILGIPALIFVMFSIFIVLLNAFEDKRKPFWQSALVFLALLMQFSVIYNLTVLINNEIYNYFVNVATQLLLLIFGLYYVIFSISNYKNYYGTSWQRVVASLIIVDFAALIVFALLYSFLNTGSSFI